MIPQTVDAVFEHGVFRPLAPLGATLTEGQHVRIAIESVGSEGDVLALAARVYEGLSEQDISEVERIALDRRTFFRNQSPA